MSFDYSAAKAALKQAGHTVSNGPQVLASDIKELVSFGRRTFGLKGSLVRRGINNTALLPKEFPGVAAAPVAEAAHVVAETPVEVPAEAPATPEATVAPQEATAPDAEDVQKVKKSKKGADESAPAETPAQETKAQDAPTGEQAAQ